jgi:excisionase family DNA binding protein
VLQPRELNQAGAGGPQEYGATIDENGLPKEISTAEAAKILGVSKDTVLKLKQAGLLEYRTAGPPGSSRVVYRFLLASVMEFRTSYQADVPIPQIPSQPSRRQVRGRQQVFKHLRLE